MINYTWTISALDIVVKEGDLEKVVNTIHWRYKGEDATDNKLVYEVYGAQGVSVEDGLDFIPYEELTEEIVIGWLEAELDVEELQKNISDNIENLKNPPIITEENPFGPKTEV